MPNNNPTTITWTATTVDGVVAPILGGADSFDMYDEAEDEEPTQENNCVYCKNGKPHPYLKSCSDTPYLPEFLEEIAKYKRVVITGHHQFSLNDMPTAGADSCAAKLGGWAHCHNQGCKLWVVATTQGVLFKKAFAFTSPGEIAGVLQELAQYTGDVCKPDADEWRRCGVCHSFVHINADHDWLVDSGTCWECYNKFQFFCYVCKELRDRSFLLTSNMTETPVDHSYVMVDRECLDELFTCNSCGRYFWKKKLSAQGFCAECGPKVIQPWNYKPQPKWIYDPETLVPSASLDYLGMELEVQVKTDQAGYLQVIAERFQKDVEGIAYLKEDSSLNNGFEIVTHPIAFNYWHKQDKLFSAISKLANNCESWAVDNCGLHIHIGRDKFNGVGHIARYLYFVNNNPLFSAFIAERYNPKQAPFLEINTIEDAVLIASCSIKIDRHCATNVQQNLSTVETRIFKGNMKRERILKNVEFVEAVKMFTYKDQNASNLTAQEFISWLKPAKDAFPNLYATVAKYKRGM